MERFTLRAKCAKGDYIILKEPKIRQTYKHSQNREILFKALMSREWSKMLPYVQQFYPYMLRKIGHSIHFLACPQLYQQLIIQCSYSRLIKMLGINLDDETNETMITLKFIGQALQGEPPNFCDFLTQYKGRIFVEVPREKYAYFDPQQLSLKDNARCDLILQFPPTTILNVVYFKDSLRGVFSLSSGLCLVINLITYTVLSIFQTSRYSIMDLVRIIDD